jgi:hypothetical protein
VIDPAKVTKNGLCNSCSIAGIMLTTQVRHYCDQMHTECSGVLG